eukprot:2378855-Heterocapsa_arctica.AAC.1
MDRAEWGAFEHIILRSKLYQIKIEVYCYGMNMQIIDGDEFSLERMLQTSLLRQKQMGRHGTTL